MAWLFYLSTPDGHALFASLLSREACGLLQALFADVGVAGVCFQYLGVPA